jgi:hypothetical protein
MPAPLMVNPLSFEELSRVPLAKAQASAEGVAALGRIKTDYNVDDKDLNKISKLVQSIDENKDKVVESIATTGVTSQTVNEVLNLKKNRDQVYKGIINQAEENKKRIDLWKNQVDEMVMNQRVPAWYANLIKSNVYEKGWTGSFDEGSDVPKTFQGNFGEKYIDMDADIREVLFQAASKGEVKTTPLGGGESNFNQIKDPNTGQVFSMFTTPGQGEHTIATNKKNLDAAIKMLKSEYKDSSTERGKFGNYVDLSDAKLDATIEKYRDLFLNKQDVSQMSSKTRQLMGGRDDKEVDLENNFVSTEPIEVVLKQLEQVKNTSGVTGVVRSLSKLNDIAGELYDKDPKAPIKWAEALSFINPAVGGIINYFLKGGRQGNWDIDNFKPIEQDFKTIFNSAAIALKPRKDADKEKLGLLQDPTMTLALDDMISKGLIPEGRVLRATRKKNNSDADAINYTYDALIDYLVQEETTRVIPNIITTNYTLTKYGKKNEGVTKVDAGKDLFTGTFNVVDIKTGDVIDGDSDLNKSLKIKGRAGKMQVDGNVPLWSPLLLDRETGKYNEDFAGAYQISDIDEKDNKGVFLAPLQSYLKETPDYARIDELNRIGLNLPKGGSAPIYMTDDAKSFYPIELVSDPRQGDPTDYSVSRLGRPSINMLYKKSDGKFYQMTEEDQSRIVGPGFAKGFKLNIIE